MNKKEQNNKGFSLVELIIVIAIMAILVGVLAPQFIKYIESSRQSTDIQNASSIRSAVEAYVAENAPSGTINVSVGSNAITVSGMNASELTSVGLNSSIPTKSSGWGSADNFASYSCTTFKWTTTNATNNNEPKKNLVDAFK